jgi:hypothetical protein
MQDGGVTAIVGFLYQLPGSAAALVSTEPEGPAMLALEHNGEDALLSMGSKTELVQFKYSAERLDIQPKELADILSKLEEHSAGPEWRWRLATNRPLKPDSPAALRVSHGILRSAINSSETPQGSQEPIATRRLNAQDRVACIGEYASYLAVESRPFPIRHPP